MESIKDLYKIGYGPSSSHTMGPLFAAERFRHENPEAVSFHVTLYGSLAATGKGHMTDRVIKDALSPLPVDIAWEPDTFLPLHPNGMKFEAFGKEGNLIKDWITYSIGGGDISDSGVRVRNTEIYPLMMMKEILAYCVNNGISFWEYVGQYENPDVWDFLEKIWITMQESIENGLQTEGVLPGGLKLPRKAMTFYLKSRNNSSDLSKRTLLYAFALAVAEENASGGKIVTAPTCGSSGVLPAVLKLIKIQENISDARIVRALATAGLIGNLIKSNASISGAEVGCQGEVGSACAMAAAAITQLLGGTPAQVEYAASIGIEHFLGLTCDPVFGLVQIPCIERNAFAAARAIDAAMYALMTDGTHVIKFDTVIHAMKQTGHDLPHIYKETAEGGLALFADK
ncbi:MAG: L-serine ammonia-lyase [Bacteroidota bacterium]|nr:L-serine ammonia-lyase [Bacteroidota bacterium]